MNNRAERRAAMLNRPPPWIRDAHLESGFKAHFLGSLVQLHHKVHNADFTIECQGEDFKVHSLILHLHSDYFKRMLRNGFVETGEKKVIWNDSDPGIVKLAIQFFYTFGYELPEEEAGRPGASAPSNVSAGAQPPAANNNTGSASSASWTVYMQSTSNLLKTHTLVHTLADRYGMPDLRGHTVERFEKVASDVLHTAFPELGDSMFYYRRTGRPQNTLQALLPDRSTARLAEQQSAIDTFVGTIPLVYEKSNSANMGLRMLVTKMWTGLTMNQKDVIGRDRMDEVLKRVPELAMDLVVGFRDAEPQQHAHSGLSGNSGRDPYR